MARHMTVAFAAMALLGSPATAGDDEERAAVLLREKAPSIVHVRYVLKPPRSGEQEDLKRELYGVLVDAGGLVVVSNSYFVGLGSGNDRWTATALRIVFGNDPKEHPAVLVAQDSGNDLAFVQPLELEGRRVVPVDWSTAVTPRVGQDLLVVTRADQSFDYVPAVGRIYVSSRLEKPRPLWGIGGDYARMTGMVCYDVEGRPAGLLVYQSGSSGSTQPTSHSAGTFLLPSDAVRKSVDLAKKRAAEVLVRAREAGSSPTAETPAPEKEPPAPPSGPTR